MGKTEKMIGLFVVSYEITEETLGSPKFTVMLAVNTPEEKVSGTGQITTGGVESPNPINTTLSGTYTYMATMKNVQILIKATGSGHIGSPVQPLEGQNADLMMVLDDNWQSGTANYKYINNNGQWISVEGAQVRVVNASLQAA